MAKHARQPDSYSPRSNRSRLEVKIYLLTLARILHNVSNARVESGEQGACQQVPL